MSVIGRLDDQVNAVLIAPLAEKERRDSEAGELAERKGARATASENAITSVQATHPTTPAPATDKGQVQEALPVWLL